MTYSVSVSGTTFTVDMTSVSLSVALSQVGQQGATGPTGALQTDTVTGDLYVSGDVGIGTSNPSYALDVASETDPSIRVRSTGSASTDDAFLRVQCAGNTTARSYLAFGDADSSFVGSIIYRHADDSMQFSVDGSERLRIDSEGIVIINEGTVVLNGNEINALQVTIADDAVAELTFPSRQGGLLWVTCEAQGSFPQINNFSGFVTVDFGDSPGHQTPIYAGNSFEMNNSGALTGTTGTDGSVTVGTAGTSGTLYIENRSNGDLDFQITLL